MRENWKEWVKMYESQSLLIQGRFQQKWNPCLFLFCKLRRNPFWSRAGFNWGKSYCGKIPTIFYVAIPFDPGQVSTNYRRGEGQCLKKLLSRNPFWSRAGFNKRGVEKWRKKTEKKSQSLLIQGRFQLELCRIYNESLLERRNPFWSRAGFNLFCKKSEKVLIKIKVAIPFDPGQVSTSCLALPCLRVWGFTCRNPFWSRAGFNF